MKKTVLWITLVLLVNTAGAQWQSNGPYDGSFTSVVINEGGLFAGSNIYGVFYSPDYNGPWVQVNNGLTDTSVTALALGSTGILAGTASKGVFLSTDNGSNWTAANTGLPSNQRITAFAVSGTTIYAGTTSAGVFLSTNNGANWAAVNNGITDLDITSIAISSSGVYAASAGNRNHPSVFFSSNNGVNWSPVNTGLPTIGYPYVTSLAVSGNNVYSGLWGGGVYVSSNNGGNWIAMSSGLPSYPFVSSLAISGANMFAGITNSGVYQSTDNGNNWTNTGLANNYLGAVSVNDSIVVAVTPTGYDSAGVWVSPLKDLPSGITESTLPEPVNIRLYPNPTADNWRLMVDHSLVGGTLEVLDEQGRLVFHSTLSTPNSKLTLGVPAGVYWLRLTSGDISEVRKLVKI